MWSAVCPANPTPAPSENGGSSSQNGSPSAAAPASRSKHSATLVGGHVYLLGGRNGNIPLKDFWRYSLADSRWEQLKPTGECPPCLQEHSAVAFKDAIYVFGGELGFSAGTETPLWVYQIKANSWRKVRSQKGVSVPRGRRGHTALVHRGAMLLYGGYQDLRGSCSELWVFDFDTESWHLVSGNAGGVAGGGGGGGGGGGQQGGGGSGDRPPARHKHSAILHEECMWVYGGMTDLQERGDFWRWDTHSKTWTNIRSRPNPGPLHGHAACKLPSSMLMFGGERDGQPTNELWRFHFGTESWERLQPSGLRPQPRAESVALAVSQLLLHPPRSSGSSNSSGDSHHSSFSSARVRPRGGGSVDRSSSTSSNNSNTAIPPGSARHFHCRVSPCDPGDPPEEVLKNMESCQDNCCGVEDLEDGEELAQEDRLVGAGEYDEDDDDEEEDCRWGPNGRRRSRPRKPSSTQMYFSAQHPNVPQSNNNLSFLREISKISQINLSRLSRHNHCSYSVLSSDSSESICNAAAGDLHSNAQSCALGCRRDHHQESYMGNDGGTPMKMVKSQSANVITVGGRGKVGGNRGRGRGGRHGVGRKAHEEIDMTPMRLSRDPVSVPNFAAIQKPSVPPLTPVEMTRLVFLDTDEDDDVTGDSEPSQATEPEATNDGSRDALIISSPAPPATDFSALHQKFQPGSGNKKRSESSHYLSDSTTDSSGIGGSGSAGTPVSTVSTVGGGSGIPKSASVRFRRQLVELEEASDETVSTSDYASIETVNCVNNSKAQTPSGVANNHSSAGGNHKTEEPDGPYGFSNPNYLGPDISTILSNTSSWKGNGNGGKGENGSSNRVQPHLQLHQTYAQLLNSPPDSVLEDSNGRSCSRFFQDDLELQSLAATPSGCSITALHPPALQSNPNAQPPLLPPPPQLRSAAVPQFLSLHSPLDMSGPARRCISASKGKGNGVGSGSKCRASSASRAECSFSSSGYHPPPPPPQPPPPPDPNVPLYMFVVGGKERGQVTLFRRPISVWRLQLAPDIF
ncbi:uncharacterized protein LOC124159707 [Ischnura elegans]|uniref:uncharacterized protein LOC124159707 n=1 Tax=Ischnura elegans TaxID=197161 RepID=UPI001ED8A036|nr:uncharacterized protein LOC124159707 [Ischnura elegans]